VTTTDAAGLRRRYLADAVETAPPPVRLTMLHDALDLDLARADAAFESGDIKAINDNLVHAQEIIITLRDTMKPELWEGAPRLIALHNYFLLELLGANVDKDRARAAAAAKLIGQLGEAWRQAAESLAAPAGTARR